MKQVTKVSQFEAKATFSVQWQMIHMLTLILTGLFLFSNQEAAGQNCDYRGAPSMNFIMELTLSGTATTGTVTGVIRCGNLAAQVRVRVFCRCFRR